MTEKRVSVRLAVVGGREVRAELEGVGEAGTRGFGRLGREMEAANTRLAAFSAPGEDRHGGRDRRGSRLRRRDDPLRARHRRRPGEAGAVARHHRRLDPGAGARGRARRRRDVRHRAGDQGPDPAAEPGRRRRRTRGRGARPARALGVRSCWRCRSTSGSAGSTRRSPTSCPRPSAPRSPASSSARKARSPWRGSTPRRCARRPRTCATSASWSPRPTPTASSGPTPRSPGSG